MLQLMVSEGLVASLLARLEEGERGSSSPRAGRMHFSTAKGQIDAL